MGSHGKVETEKLRKNLEDQLERLVQQLEDLEECRNELEDGEYQETKEETMEQLREFNDSLQRLISGDVSLVNELGAMQLATQAAISAAFETPAVIRMFGKREPNQLREKLLQIDRDIKLGKLSNDAGERQKGEVLGALKHLGETLEPREVILLEKLALGGITHSSFVRVTENASGQAALALAGKEIKAAQST